MFFLKDLPSEKMIAGVAGHLQDVSPTHILHVLAQLRRASVLLRDVDTYLRKSNLSQTQFLAMMMIIREPERRSLSPSEIAARLDVSKPVLSKALASIEKKGLIEAAKTQPSDGRQRQLTLTQQGHKIFAELLPGYFALLQSAKI